VKKGEKGKKSVDITKDQRYETGREKKADSSGEKRLLDSKKKNQPRKGGNHAILTEPYIGKGKVTSQRWPANGGLQRGRGQNCERKRLAPPGEKKKQGGQGKMMPFKVEGGSGI